MGACDELPNGVELSDVPDYYYENHYLEEKVNAINDAIAESHDNCETFFWITDIHWEPSLNTRNSPFLMKYIASKTGINTILNGGDTGNSQIICKNAISQLKNAIASSRVYSVNGNHEINDASRYELPFERVNDELRGHNTDLVFGDKNKSFFYHDDMMNETRYIGLSSFGLYINNTYESCYTTEQLEWFKNTALDVDTGWTIIVFTHVLYDIDISSNRLKTGPLGSKAIIDAIDNYKGNGTIACVLMGHTHRDRLHLGSTGVPYIISASDRHATYYGDIDVKRIPGTITEQHFEVVVIDKSQRKIQLFSIGAKARDGYDDVAGDEVDVRIISY